MKKHQLIMSTENYDGSHAADDNDSAEHKTAS